MKTHTEQYQVFLESLKDCGYSYPEFAGVVDLYLSDNDVTEDSDVLPGSGDIVVYNEREGGGIFGMSHDDGELCFVEFSEESDSPYNDEDCAEPKRELYVSSEYLWERYGDIARMFSTLHRDHYIDFGFESYADLIEDYLDEQEHFENDPHLCLYWLIVFGFLGVDDRFSEVLIQSPEGHLLIQQCVAFFEEFSDGLDIDLSYEYDSEEVKSFYRTAFKTRHANLLEHFFG